VGRSRKSDGFNIEDLYEFLLIVPYWFGPIIAFVVFAFLYWFIPWVGTPDGPDDVGAQILSGMVVPLSVMLAPYAAGVVILLWLIAEAKKRFGRDSRSSMIRLFEEAEKEHLRQDESRAPTVSTHESAPSCPKCSATMTLRRAKRGTNAGSQFWGCPHYPRCKGTRNL